MNQEWEIGNTIHRQEFYITFTLFSNMLFT